MTHRRWRGDLKPLCAEQSQRIKRFGWKKKKKIPKRSIINYLPHLQKSLCVWYESVAAGQEQCGRSVQSACTVRWLERKMKSACCAPLRPRCVSFAEPFGHGWGKCNSNISTLTDRTQHKRRCVLVCIMKKNASMFDHRQHLRPHVCTLHSSSTSEGIPGGRLWCCVTLVSKDSGAIFWWWVKRLMQEVSVLGVTAGETLCNMLGVRVTNYSLCLLSHSCWDGERLQMGFVVVGRI